MASPRKRFILPTDTDDDDAFDSVDSDYKASTLFNKVKEQKLADAKATVAATTTTTSSSTSKPVAATAATTSSNTFWSAATGAKSTVRETQGTRGLCETYIDKLKQQQQQEAQNKQQQAQSKQQQEAQSKQQSSAEQRAASSSGAVVKSGRTIPSTSYILVNMRQKGNPVLKHIRNVPWQYGDIVPDYQMGATTCALYLSLRYHHLKPEYVHSRLDELGRSYELRVMLVQVDVADPHHSVKELAQMCLLAQCTLLLAWSCEEAGRYLETYKAYEHKPPDMIKSRPADKSYMAQVTHVLTAVKSINKTDALTLVTTFGSMANIMKATVDELSLCPGFGLNKAQRLYDAFHQPFKRHRPPTTSTKPA